MAKQTGPRKRKTGKRTQLYSRKRIQDIADRLRAEYRLWDSLAAGLGPNFCGSLKADGGDAIYKGLEGAHEVRKKLDSAHELWSNGNEKKWVPTETDENGDPLPESNGESGRDPRAGEA